MESVPGERRPLSVAISSDASLLPIVSSNNDSDWLGEFLWKELDDGLVSENSDDVVVISEFSPRVKSRKRKLEENGSDDECLMLDGDPKKLVSVSGSQEDGGGSESDDLIVVGETGQVACRDYPHSRHDCIKFPFNTTPHVEHCHVCHCYVCDSPAPCIYWGTGMSNSDHCNANDKDGDWKNRRTDFKLGKSTGQNNLSKDCGSLPSMAPLPNQNRQPGSAQLAANLTPRNPLSQEVMTYQSGQATLPVNTPRPTNLTPQNFVLRPAVYHPSSQAPCYGNTSPANPQNYVVRPPVSRRCSLSVSYGTSNNICHGREQQRSENLITGLRPLYAPRMASTGFIVAQPAGGHFSSSMSPQHVSSVARFNEAGTVYSPPASIAGYAPNNLYWATPGQFDSNLQKYTVAGHDNFLRQNTHPHPHLRSDTRSAQINALGTLPNAVPSGSSGFFPTRGAIAMDAWTVNPITQQIQDARAVDPSDHASHQNQDDAFRHVAQAIEHQQPVQLSNHHLPQDSGLSSAATKDNWWSENELYQDQLPVDAPAAANAVPSGSSGFFPTRGAIAVDAWTVNPINQQIQDARAVDPSDHAGHQNQDDAFQHVAQAIERQQPVQLSNHHLPQDSGHSSAAIKDNWWSENELYQDQLPVDAPPAAAAVDIGKLLFDFETSWNGATC